MNSPKKLAGVFLALALAPSVAHAWGHLGHRMIAENAAILIAEDPKLADWGKLLARHRFELGVYATYPDNIYRYIDGNDGKTEAPTHFFDIDAFLGAPANGPKGAKAYVPGDTDQLPREWDAFRKQLEPKLGAERFRESGSVPWRIEQFMELVWNDLKDVKRVQGGYQRGAKSEGDALRVFRAMYHMGILAHYSGDAVMPYHATEDWNGWGTGQGGIHFYSEADCVNELEPSLSPAGLQLARKQGAKWLKEWRAGKDSAAGLMFRIMADSYDAIRPLSKLDREHAVLRPSDAKTKAFAKRKPAQQGCPPMRGHLVERLAKASVLTAYLWRWVLPESGVDFTKADTLLFSDIETQAPYVAPDYKPVTFPKAR